MLPVLLALSLAGTPPPRPRAPTDEARHHPELALAVVGGTYATAAAYTYLAWYRRSENSDTLGFREEGLFGHDTYAGGADKLGHAWSNYVLTRSISGVLSWGGVSQAASIATSASLAFGFFALIELKDGYEPMYGFSWGDVLFNAGGSALGIGAEMFPALDDFIAFRLQYWPSRAFVRRVNSGGALNFAEDYSGQAFLVSYHLSSIATLREGLAWPEFVDLTLGYRALNYEPPDARQARLQELFVGLSLNLQRVVDRVFSYRAPEQAPAGVRAIRFATQVLAPPFTTLEISRATRR
jgi:hypothetical protein